MQRFISKYALAAHLALTAVAPLVLFPFLSADALATVLLWLTAPAALWMLMEPSRRSTEMLHDARTRVFLDIVRDPLTWLLLVLTALAAARWANGGIRMAYSTETLAWSLSVPDVPWLPGAVDGCGRLAFAVTLAMSVLTLACRHALGKSARVSFLMTGSLLAGVAALLAVTLGALGNETVLAATKAGLANASYHGSVFGLWMLAGVVSVSGGFELRWNKYLLLFSLGIGGCATGLFFFAPTPVLVLFAGAFVLVTAGSLGSSWFAVGSVDTSKCFITVLLAMLVPVLMVLWVAPSDLIAGRFSLLTSGAIFPDGYFQARALLSDVARKAWRVHPWSGTGLGSFPLDMRLYAGAADWHVFAPLQSTALNGWWQFLAERGLVGAIGLLGCVALVLVTFIRRLVASFGKSYLVPVAFFGPVSLAVVTAEAFFTASLLSPALQLAVLPLFALGANSFPVLKKTEPVVTHGADVPSGTEKEETNNG